MKKLLIGAIAALLSFSVLAFDDVDFTISDVITTNQGTATLVDYGAIEFVYVDVPATKTGTVTVATAEDTIYSASLTTDTIVYPRVVVNEADGSVNTNGAITKFVAVGAITVTVEPAANTTGTNDWAVTVGIDD